MTETDIYNAYQKAQRGEGYLLIGIKGLKRDGKQVIRAIPPCHRDISIDLSGEWSDKK